VSEESGLTHSIPLSRLRPHRHRVDGGFFVASAPLIPVI
jgi:hypothetical protein